MEEKKEEKNHTPYRRLKLRKLNTIRQLRTRTRRNTTTNNYNKRKTKETRTEARMNKRKRNAK